MSVSCTRAWFAMLLAAMAVTHGDVSYGQTSLPPPAAAIEVREQLGSPVPRDVRLTNTRGQRVTLGEYFDGVRPLMLTLAYTRCPMLCDLVLRGAIEAMPQLSLTLGRDFRAVTLLIDPSETPESARAKQATVLNRLGRSDASDWPFLVGDEAAIRRVADAVGFGYVKDERTGQFAHPAVVILLTPEGRVSSYLHGVRFPVETVRRGLAQAASGHTSSRSGLREAIMRCFRFEPALRKYGPSITSAFRWGGGVLLLSVALSLAWLFRRERRKS